MDEDDAGSQDLSSELASTSPRTAAINSQYAAWLEDNQINIQKLASQTGKTEIIQYQGSYSNSSPVLALSSVQPNVLAITSGSSVRIFDLGTESLTCTVQGIGRAVTALSWSKHNSKIVATGSIDGSVCLWDLRTPNRPLRRLRAFRGPCESIVFSSFDKHSVACIQERSVSFWNLRRSSVHPVHTSYCHGTKFSAVAWHPETPDQLLATTEDGQLSLQDVSGYMQDGDGDSMSSSSEDDDQRETLASKATASGKDATQIWTAKLESPLSQAQFLNNDILYGLAWHGHQAFVFQTPQNGEALTTLYSHDFEEKADALQIKVQSGTGAITSTGTFGVDVCDLPVSLLDQLGRHDGSPAIEKSKSFASEEMQPWDSGAGPDPSTRTLAIMQPISIFHQRQSSSGFPKTSKQLRRRSQRRSDSRVESHGRKFTNGSQELPTPSAIRSMTSSLELPKPKGENVGASMPFLSPSIPARQSPSDLPSLEDSSLILPPLATSSFDSSLPSTVGPVVADQDSDDSDDETFVDGMQGSTSFLPGGINVPLPKACGALFASNGHLLTFFPPKQRPSSVRERTGQSQDGINGRSEKVQKTSRLFPSFGNFERAALLADDDSGSDSSSSFDSFGNNNNEGWPAFPIPRSSFQSQPSWTSRVSPTKAEDQARSGQTKVVISVYEIDDVPALCTAQRTLAKRYRMLRNESESGTDICNHNAEIADTEGLHDRANIWNLIGMLLCDKVPLELLEDGIDDILVVAKRAKTLTRSDSGVDLVESADNLYSCGQLRWTNSPFGANWLIRGILSWAEQCSDMQLLACICAVLTDAQPRSHESGRAVQDPFLKNLPTHSSVYEDSHAQRDANRIQPIPVLRTNSIANSSSVYESPSKLYRTSNTSSRNASQPTSQPTTPYLESNSSTPPFSLPSFSRQSTHLSTSGSASPEYARSSFSAAAKYYAQSITDKFASYGTSPPTKRLGTSPSASNEFPASLPSGSWGKSVSFAMSSTTGDTTRGSLLSRSYDEQSSGKNYEDERTAGDESPGYLPKDPKGPVFLEEKNQDMFSDHVSGGTKLSLIPGDLTDKSIAWCQYYAEQLRSWDLHMQATELEKIVGISESTDGARPIGVVPLKQNVFSTSFKDNTIDRTCAICYNVVRLMELLCPSCHHVSHLNCLEGYFSELEDADFTCPTSCGCSCSDVAFAMQDIQQPSPQLRPTFKKKPSLTDPRRWRARVEGDSW